MQHKGKAKTRIYGRDQEKEKIHGVTEIYFENTEIAGPPNFELRRRRRSKI